ATEGGALGPLRGPANGGGSARTHYFPGSVTRAQRLSFVHRDLARHHPGRRGQLPQQRDQLAGLGALSQASPVSPRHLLVALASSSGAGIGAGPFVACDETERTVVRNSALGRAARDTRSPESRSADRNRA